MSYDPATVRAVWRTGRKVGRTIYEQRGDEPSDDDPLIGVMDTPEWAAAAVTCRNFVASCPEDVVQVPVQTLNDMAATVEVLREALERIGAGDVPGTGDFSDCVQRFAREVLAATLAREDEGWEYRAVADQWVWAGPAKDDPNEAIRAALAVGIPREAIRLERSRAAVWERVDDSAREDEGR